MPFIFPDTHTPADLSRLGGKAKALAILGEQGFEIPGWFAVPPDTTWTEEELLTAIVSLRSDLLAVRSSGAMEDGAGYSFAGQFDTYLDVFPSQVEQQIFEVRKSAKGEAILKYCSEHRLPEPPVPTVLVQQMILPKFAGVAFSADPVSGRRSVVVVSGVEGLGEKLVSGEEDGETWRIERSGNVAEQPPEGKMSLENVLGVAELAQRCELAFGRPQDIEWAIDASGKLWLLQSRPITTLGRFPDPDDALWVWDNSNIAESYGGITTPLTFSFARRIYESVYREFCGLMSVPGKRIEKSDAVFPQMLGLIRGRVFYNLVSWYHVLALLPGFHVNRSFMEQMMGVREPMPDEVVQRIIHQTREGKWADAMALARTCGGLIVQFLTLPWQIKRFQARLDQALSAPAASLHRMSGEELVLHYQDLERQLLKKWDAPLVNDFFAMIFYGVLRSLCVKWLGDENGTKQNELLLDSGDIISAEPPRRILKMAELARLTPGLPELLLQADLPIPAKLKALNANPELATLFEQYLTDFGDRCLEELKLESPTVRDDPSSLLSSIGAMALRDIPLTPEDQIRTEMPIIKGRIKALIFKWVLKNARRLVTCRENLRFERTRLFGRVRAIMRELGKRLHADGVLDDPRDVFYLELGEILSAWNSTGTVSSLSGLAGQRQAEFADYANMEAPPDRFMTRGPVTRYSEFESTQRVENVEGSLKGSGACPGRVIGRVRVVLDPRGARLEPGEILVARQTDPGWVVLFPAAAGLLVERGSLLSHSAIVSRELRLPCIVSLPGITTLLKTGDLVEMDGASGAVRILES